MSERRCPLCKGMLLDNICINCGFEALEEQDISSAYDFDPDNDSFGEAEPEKETDMESVGEVDTASLLSAENLRRANDMLQYKAAQKNAALKTQTNTPPPVRNKTPMQPVQPPPQQQFSLGETVIKDFVDWLRKDWWKALLTLINPTFGMFIGIIYFAMVKTEHGPFRPEYILKGAVYCTLSGIMLMLSIGIVDTEIMLRILNIFFD